ncbi:hypothetical protein Tco_0600865 [Tanacetum coccineum]
MRDIRRRVYYCKSKFMIFDDGMKKIIMEQSKRKVSKNYYIKVEKFDRSTFQRQLYKALVKAYEAHKILLDTYGDTVTIKRPRDGADDDQEPSAGIDRGSKRRKTGKEPDSTSAPSETKTKTAGKTTSIGSKTHKKSASQSALVGEAMQSTDVFEGSADQEFETGVQDEQAEEEVEWHDYKHLDWITVRRDDDVLYKFKEGDFHRLRIQDIEDMLLLLVQGKVTNLSVE